MSNKTIENYWKMLENLDSDTKLVLISKLSKSIKTSKKIKEISASMFSGIWADGQSAEDLIENIRSARTNIRIREIL